MAVSARTKLVLWTRAGGRCAFPDCRRELVWEGSKVDREVLLGEIAHLVAQSCDGPRGSEKAIGGNVDGVDNLMLLCEQHHKVIDGQPQTYPVAKLLQIKADHERWVRDTLSRDDRYRDAHQPIERIVESLSSTMLPVERLPKYIYSAPCTAAEKSVAAGLRPPPGSRVMYPFIIREKRLYAFNSLRGDQSPFRPFIDETSTLREEAMTWWTDENHTRWYVELLNRCMNKVTGRKGLHLDREHKRYFFPPSEDGGSREVKYCTRQGRTSKRQVAYQPTRRSTGETKNYWEHYAVGLSFMQCAANSWCFCIRPERRFTRDGQVVLTPRGTGRRSGSRKSRMYNIDFLEEVHFWRDFLAEGSPRVLCSFGSQQLTISTDIITIDVEWPGVAGDAWRPEKVTYEEDLFTLAELNSLEDFDTLDDEDFADDDEE